MLFKLLACNVFTREACLAIAGSPHVVDVEFFELGEHVNSAALRARLQAAIDATARSAKRYDAVLLLYGLCGNTAVGLEARGTPLVLPRAHDCCTILLGSRDRFRAHFEANPSRPFSCTGYLERGEYYLRTIDGDSRVYYGDAFAAYVEQYGEENAAYIWETMHPPHLAEAEREAVYIELPETAGLGHRERFAATVAQEGKTMLRLDGDLGLVRRLLDGAWDPAEFLIVQPGQRVGGVYDWTEVVRAVPAAPG
jgi:hypothetical protein